MQILSHRGYWHTPAEKNTAAAFRRSFRLGYGTETDIRDCNGALVIAHDMATAADMPLETFLALYREEGNGLPLALNIKADGLQIPLQAALTAADVRNAFVFDMSVPDTLGYQRVGLPFFTRQSDLEPTPALLAAAHGVWLDSFGPEDWITAATLAPLLAAGKAVCLVSPELHKRPHLPFWERLRGFAAAAEERLLLCTDFPEEATAFFGPLVQSSKEAARVAA
jgi:hypothetical protein